MTNCQIFVSFQNFSKHLNWYPLWQADEFKITMEERSMATGILVYEQDPYILNLLIDRLKTLAPEAYIADGTNEILIKDIENFCDEYYVMYDNKSYPETFRDMECAVPIYEDGIIDCSKLLGRMKIQKHDPLPAQRSDPKLTLLMSFVYVADREKFIEDELSDIAGSDYAFRFDFAPRIKCTGRPNGSLVELMSLAGRKRFKAEQIADHCSMDEHGFFTPGPVSSSTDLNNFSPDVFGALTSKIKELTSDDKRDTRALIVADGVKTEIMTCIARFADRIILLIPDIKTQYYDGICELISSVSRAASGTDIEIRYLSGEELKKSSGDEYEDAV